MRNIQIGPFINIKCEKYLPFYCFFSMMMKNPRKIQVNVIDRCVCVNATIDAMLTVFHLIFIKLNRNIFGMSVLMINCT